MSTVFSLNGVSYKAGKKQILKDVSFTLKEGDVFALLGHNGSGKSTLINIIFNDIVPDIGEINREKISRAEYHNLGVVFDKSVIFPMLKIKELVHFYSVIYNKDYSVKGPEYAEAFGLEDSWNTCFYKLSAGERRKVLIMLAVLHNPGILILDEPFSNLDPVISDKIWNLIAGQGRTIFFTSHDWDFAFRHASQICFLHKGSILHFPGSPSDYMATLPAPTKMVTPYKKEIEELLNGNEYYINDDKISFFATDFKPYIKGIQAHTRNFSLLDADIRDVYMLMLKKHEHA